MNETETETAIAELADTSDAIARQLHELGVPAGWDGTGTDDNPLALYLWQPGMAAVSCDEDGWWDANGAAGPLPEAAGEFLRRFRAGEYGFLRS